MRHSGTFLEHGFQGFYPLLGLYATILQSLSGNSALFFWHYPCDHLMNYFESHSFVVSIMGLIVSLVFLILPWLPQCFKWNTFFISISLPLFHSFIQGWFVLLSFEKFFSLFFLIKNPKILFPLPVKEKTQWNRLYMKKQKLKYQIYL